MELFEVPPDGVVSRKVFVDRVVEIFVQRRSLQLTLADYEVGVRRHLGYRIGSDRYGEEKFSRRVRHSPIPCFCFAHCRYVCRSLRTTKDIESWPQSRATRGILVTPRTLKFANVGETKF